MGQRAPLSTRDALTVARILKVNHAGEYGAIRIYLAQISVASWRCKDVVPALIEMLAHERQHCAAFLSAMPARNSRPCRVMPLWSWGGWVLGFLTALMGRKAIWTCTAAVEAAVHRHLDDQIYFLEERDRALCDVVHGIRAEELSHLSYAEARAGRAAFGQRILRAIITHATDVAIWLSTWGDSTRMARDLRAALPR